MHKIIILSLLTSLAIAPGSAAAQQAARRVNWSATSTADALRLHLRAGERVLVLGAGSAAATDVVTPIVSGLRAASASLVMDGSTLGDLSALNDEQLLARAAALPVDTVWIVRVFPGAQPKQVSAVILVYERDSAMLRYAVQALPGRPLPAPPAAAATASTGLEAHTAQSFLPKKTVGPKKTPKTSPKKAPPKKTAPSDDKQRKLYGASMLGVDTVKVFALDGEELESVETPYKSDTKKPLTWPRFYQEVGRLDLAEQYESNQTTKAGLKVGGIVALTLGVTLAATGLIADDEPLGSLTLGGALALSGGALWVISALSDPAVATPDENRRMAQQHNEALRRSLGLKDERADASRYKWRLAPNLRAPGLQLSLQF